MSQPGNPFVVPGMAPELADIINVHRGLFGGFTMTATPPEGAPAAPDDAGQPPVAPAATPEPPKAPEAPAWDGKVESLPQGAQDLIKGLRTENAAKRTAAKTAEDDANAKIAAALKALGIDTGTEDPVKVAEQAKAERDAQAESAKDAQRQLTVFLNAGEADPARLLKFTDFLDAIKGLEPSDVDGIKKAVADAVTANPWLKAVQVPAKSGPEFNGGTGGQGKPTTLEDAIAAKLGASN